MTCQLWKRSSVQSLFGKIFLLRGRKGGCLQLQMLKKVKIEMTAVMGCFDLQRLANMILAKCHRLVEKFGLKSPRRYVPTNITRRLQLPWHVSVGWNMSMWSWLAWKVLSVRRSAMRRNYLLHWQHSHTKLYDSKRRRRSNHDCIWKTDLQRKKRRR
jgi:hypothetical protein